MKTLIRLFWDIIIGKGFNRSSEKTFNKRMSICRKNMCFSYRKPLGIKALERCKSCGCFLNVKTRIDEFYNQCPKGLWK